MISRVIIFTIALSSVLSGCSSPPVKPQDVIESNNETPPLEQEIQADNFNSPINPPLTSMKDNKTLNLVRVMDGGICKNELQGVSGSFLLYADPHDIERIKREKPLEIFNSFEQKIQDISSKALEQAIEETNLGIDPFSLGEDAAREKLAVQLSDHFRDATQSPLESFRLETTLTIDVMPFEPSLIFYQNGCDIHANED